jgi:hypothetical protein
VEQIAHGIDEQTAEQTRQHPDREKEAGQAGNPDAPVRTESSTGGDDVNVGVETPARRIP